MSFINTAANRLAAARRLQRAEKMKAEKNAVVSDVGHRSDPPLPLRRQDHSTTTNSTRRRVAVLPEITLLPVKKPGELDLRYHKLSTVPMYRDIVDNNFNTISVVNADVSQCAAHLVCTDMEDIKAS